MPRERFSKDVLTKWARAKVIEMQRAHSFDPARGYAQVIGGGEEANRYYGEWAMLLELIERFDLEVST